MRVLLVLLVTSCAADQPFDETLTVSRGDAISFTVDGQPGGDSYVLQRTFGSFDEEADSTIVATFADGTSASIALHSGCLQHTRLAGGPFAYSEASCNLVLTEHQHEHDPSGYDYGDIGPGLTGSCTCVDLHGNQTTNDVTVRQID